MQPRVCARPQKRSKMKIPPDDLSPLQIVMLSGILIGAVALGYVFGRDQAPVRVERDADESDDEEGRVVNLRSLNPRRHSAWTLVSGLLVCSCVALPCSLLFALRYKVLFAQLAQPKPTNKQTNKINKQNKQTNKQNYQ